MGIVVSLWYLLEEIPPDHVRLREFIPTSTSTTDLVTSSDDATITDLITTADATFTTDLITTADATITTDLITTADATFTTDLITTADATITTDLITTADATITTDLITTADATITTDLITTADATITTDLITTADAAIQTGESQVCRERRNTDSNPDVSGDELEASGGDDNTCVKTYMTPEGEAGTSSPVPYVSGDELEASGGDDNTCVKTYMTPEGEAGTSSPVPSAENPGADQRRGTAVTDITSAVDKVEIILEKHMHRHKHVAINQMYQADGAQFNWDSFREEILAGQIAAQQTIEEQSKATEDTLKKEIDGCKSMIQECSEKLMQQNASNTEKIEQLNPEMLQHRKELERKQQELAELQRQTRDMLASLATEHVEVKRKETEAKTLVFKLAAKHNLLLEHVWSGLEQSQLESLLKRLYQQFQIRLRQIDVSITSMDVTVFVDDVDALAEQKAAIQRAILEEIIPEHFQAEVDWESTTPVLQQTDLDPPVQVSEVQGEDSSEAGSTSTQQITPTSEPLLTFDPMTAVPRRSFEIDVPEVEGWLIRSLLITRNRLIVLADTHKITCVPLDRSSHAFSVFPLSANPNDLAMYDHDRNIIAVATNTDVIVLLEVGSDAMHEVGKVKTERRYLGVTSFGDGDILVVISKEDDLGPAVIDVITREGKVLWTVADTQTLPHLRCPRFLHIRNREVLVSDINGLIHRVDVTSGTPHPALYHPDLKLPCNITTDPSGSNVFVADRKENKVLLYSMMSGEWRTLLTEQDGRRGNDSPQAVGVTDDGQMVVAWISGVVVCYSLKP
ncbi:uncharacterized protein LOC143277732 [Babylonia areolata]|uniref:uncharacterized protein LOC143277732 n=1 Tax=Babylonia areolata TaxID=304850 RepID=UPI003FD1E602